jgi:hypothetical protein
VVAAGLMVIGAVVPVIVPSTVSVAVTVRLPAVFSAAPAAKVCVPASPPTKV